METDEEGFLASHFFMQLIAAVVLIFYSTLDSRVLEDARHVPSDLAVKSFLV